MNMFANFTPYAYTGPLLAEQAAQAAQFAPCAPSQASAHGYVRPRGGAGDLLVEPTGFLSVMIERKAVPSDVLARRVQAMAERVEAETGRKPGKKQRGELKEQAMLELLPAAFPKRKTVPVQYLPQLGLILVGSTSAQDLDIVTNLLVRTVDGLTLGLLQTKAAPAARMASWLLDGEAAAGFTIDRECELKSSDELKSVVRYARHNLDTDEVRDHIRAGKMPTSLALTYDDRVSFKLTDALQFKSCELLDLAFEGKGEDRGDAFDADLLFWRTELGLMLAALTVELSQ